MKTARRGFGYAAALAWLLVLFAGQLDGFADGKIFPARFVQTGVETPDQRALLHYSNGVERLVIETSFRGEGTNFAWVIPFPSEPKIEAVSTNFFKHVEAGFQPEIVHEPRFGWTAAIVIVWLIVAIAIEQHRRKGRGGLMTFILLLFLGAMVGGMFLPALSTAKGGREGAEAVKVLQRGRAGVFDTIVLKGTNGTEVLGWLNENGYATPSNALPVITAYAREGWVFAAATLARHSGETAISGPHPLAFTFETAQAVYPMRLTGVDNPSCHVELYVFGEARAEAPGFEVQFCGRPEIPQPRNSEELHERAELFGFAGPRLRAFSDGEVISFAFPSTVTTKLRGRLTTADMINDVYLNWAAYKEQVRTLHTWRGALGVALTGSTAILCVGLLFAQIFKNRVEGATLGWILAAIVAAAVAFAIIRFSTAELTTVNKVKWAGHARSHFRYLEQILSFVDMDRTNGAAAPRNLEEFKAQAGLKEDSFQNAFEYGPLREEPTPGNVTFTPSDTGVSIYWYDIRGVPHLLITMTNGPAGGGR